MNINYIEIRLWPSRTLMNAPLSYEHTLHFKVVTGREQYQLKEVFDPSDLESNYDYIMRRAIDRIREEIRGNEGSVNPPTIL